ncbi:MAG TPA: sulfite exporter TauE/SafE family protein [Pyrinomonadaceae bacterium]|nr:sulfite exporter TauE/SafE family protein [Pyrinomonadaceae bacterium]
MSVLFIIGLILSAVIGLSLGLIGGGGSILTVPILVYLLGVGPHEAVPMSLAVVGATSILGSYMHWRRDNVDISTGLLFGVAGIVGALLGSPLTKLVSPELLLLIFGLLMLVVAVSMIWRRKHKISGSTHKPHPVQGIFAGLGVGVLTGFLGVGGGFLIVPALVFFGGLNMKKAIGTSLFVIFLNCAAGLVGHMSQNIFDWGLTGIVMALAVAGAIVGTLLSQRIAAQRLQSLFAVLVLGVAAFLVVKNYAVIY